MTRDHERTNDRASGVGKGETVMREEDGVLVVELKGAQTLQAAHRTAETILSECLARGCTRVLVDARKQVGRMSIAELYDLATRYEGTWVRAVRVAILDRKDRVQPDRFLQKTARNRGLDVMTFTELRAAKAWLDQVAAPART